MYSVSTSDITTLAYLVISYLVSSSPSSWINESGASTYMTGKFIVFSILHTTSCASSIVFDDGSSKRSISTGTINLTSSLTRTDVNYISHVLFNLVFVNRLTKALQCSITFSFLHYVLSGQEDDW